MTAFVYSYNSKAVFCGTKSHLENKFHCPGSGTNLKQDNFTILFQNYINHKLIKVPLTQNFFFHCIER